MSDKRKSTNQRFTEENLPSKYHFPRDQCLKTTTVPLRHALQALNKHILRLDHYLERALNECYKHGHHGLTIDESAAIYLYTMQWAEGSSTSLYYILNSDLRSGNRDAVLKWFPYLKIFIEGLKKLPSVKQTVWRNIKANIIKDYIEKQEFTWANVVSSSIDRKIVLEQFWDHKTGQNTLFKIEVIDGKSISAYSRFPKENEIVLLPGSTFVVNDIYQTKSIAECKEYPRITQLS